MCKHSPKLTQSSLRHRTDMKNQADANTHEGGSSEKHRTTPPPQARSPIQNQSLQRRHHIKTKARPGPGGQLGDAANARNGTVVQKESLMETQLYHGRGHAGGNDGQRHLKRHSNLQRSSPSKHLHMNNQSADVSRTSPVPSNTTARQRQSPPVTPGKSLSLPAYAGAKFSDPPSPAVLPKPPVHWVSGGGFGSNNSCAEMTSILKVMLKVQA